MEHSKAQKRLLISTAFFSSGCLGGALTFMRLSDASAAGITESCGKLLSVNPLLYLPAVIMLPVGLMCAVSASAHGKAFIAVSLYFTGFLSGAVMDASLRFSCHPFLVGEFLILYTICMTRISASMFHLASYTRLQLRCGGRFRPDRSYDRKLAASASAVLLLASFAIAYYLLRS
jgi:hypothetical protein